MVASAVLLVLCLLVLLSNYLDSVHTRKVKNSIATLYEDRLVAEYYILKMTRTMYQIREASHTDLDTASTAHTIREHMDDFHDSYNTYIKTKLTATENATAMALMDHIKKLEQQFSNSNDAPSDYTAQALVDLNTLSTIQLEESNIIMKNAESTYASIKTSSQFAFAIVLLILVVLQALVFSTKTLMPVNKPQDPTLN